MLLAHEPSDSAHWVTYSQSDFQVPVILGAFFSSQGVLPGEHLDECVALVLVDDAGLDSAEAAENATQLLLRASVTVD